jgi:bacterioferritin-associated ferredoxin
MCPKQESKTICRCSDVTLEEVEALIREGYTTLTDIKRLSRAGMGQCQGKTCRNLLLQVIAKATKQKIEDLEDASYRPPAITIPLGLLAEEGSDEK